MSSIKMQTQIEVLEHHIVKLNHQMAEQQQVLDLLTARVEVLDAERNMRNAAVKDVKHGRVQLKPNRRQTSKEAPF